MKALLVGDLCHRDNNRKYFEKKDMKILFGDVAEYFKDNDIFALNLECAITESDNAIQKYGPNLKVCRETADVMKKMGVTLCGLSNNHIFDFGKEGYEDTVKALYESGIAYTGFGKNYEDSRRDYVVEKDGEKVAVIAVCEHEYSYALSDRMGSRPFDEFETMADIRKAKKDADRVIVMYHGGKEMCQYPSPRLMKACREMANNGADVILCQHTHCIGAYENYNGCHILYGQGNFHFIGEADYEDIWHKSLMVKYNTRTHEINFIPTVNTEFGIELAKGKEKEEIMAGFQERCRSLKDGTWLEGWCRFCLSVEERYRKMINDSQLHTNEKGNDTIFAHYLDCEAHTDVLREIFKTANHRNEN